MQENLKHTIANLIAVDALNGSMTTSKVVRFLNNKKYHSEKLRSPEFAEILGRRRSGAGRNFLFNTLKVIEFKERIEAKAVFS